MRCSPVWRGEATSHRERAAGGPRSDHLKQGTNRAVKVRPRCPRALISVALRSWRHWPRHGVGGRDTGQPQLCVLAGTQWMPTQSLGGPSFAQPSQAPGSSSEGHGMMTDLAARASIRTSSRGDQGQIPQFFHRARLGEPCSGFARPGIKHALCSVNLGHHTYGECPRVRILRQLATVMGYEPCPCWGGRNASSLGSLLAGSQGPGRSEKVP